MKKLMTLLTGSVFFIFQSSIVFAEGAAPAGRSNYMQTFLMIGITLVFLYLLILRPEQKRRKKAESLRSGIKKGDRVTAMGIIGIVSQVKDKTLVLKMCEGAKIEVLKGAVTDVQQTLEEKGSNSEEAPAK